MMNIAEYINANRPVPTNSFYTPPVPKIKCADGFEMSVQASETHYCDPRENFEDASIYTSMEVGYPSATEPLLMEYAEDENNPTGTVYGWVPVETINKVLENHGGIKESI